MTNSLDEIESQDDQSHEGILDPVLSNAPGGLFWGLESSEVQPTLRNSGWSHRKGEPRIAAGQKRDNKTVWLRKYASIRESIIDYYLVLGRASAYSDFRNLKMETTDPHQLVTGLSGYSERKTGYVRELSSIIRYNNFHELD